MTLRQPLPDFLDRFVRAQGGRPGFHHLTGRPVGIGAVEDGGRQPPKQRGLVGGQDQY
jgi:hypothetical protein